VSLTDLRRQFLDIDGLREGATALTIAGYAPREQLA